MRAGKIGDEARRVGLPLERQGGQAQAGRPSFGALGQQRNLGLAQRGAVEPLKQGLRLGQRKLELFGMELGQIAARAGGPAAAAAPRGWR